MIDRMRRFTVAVILLTTLSFATACTTSEAVYWSKIAVGVADQLVNP